MPAKKNSAWDELRQLQDASLRIWTMYVAWFTWSLGLNLLAGSYILTQSTIRPDVAIGLGSLMVLGHALSIGAGFKQRAYFLATIERAADLRTRIDGDPDIELMFAAPIAGDVSWSVPLAHAATLLGWVALIAKYGFGLGATQLVQDFW